MSSSGSSSRKEQNVIAQQRKLAALLAKRSTSQLTVDASKAGPTTAKLPPSSSAVAPNGAHPQQRQIRPGLKRPNSSSASAVLAEARARAAAKKDPENSQKSEAEVIEIKESPILQRKTKASDPSRLANLVRNVAAAPTGDEAMQSAAFASNVTPSDFWKNIREWDFVSDLVKINNDKDETVIIARKPIPDTFISFRHYISLWAPLCLAETRAQLVSELMTSSNLQWSKAKLFIEVEVETTWKSDGRRDRNLHSDLTDIDSCSVMLGTKERNTGAVQFFANDVFCLIPVEHRDTVELLLNGKKISGNDGSFKRFCIVGHTEVLRKEINGLILRVSKRKWAQMGTSTMYLLRIGANITALREFTALCGVENIPLKRYLLGHHLSEKGKQDGASRASTTALFDANSMRKEVMLKQMGGVQALGKGFTDYAQKKFNPSQLMAISASSTGYGEGGITLIKGPPGTGKTTTLTAILNSLHIRQYNKYYEEVRRIAAMKTGHRQGALEAARQAKPRLLVCAPSNSAVDNIILKIMEDGFVDGSGMRYNPSMIRVGIGQSSAVSSISLETKINQILSEVDMGQVESAIAGYRMELQRISTDITSLRQRCQAIIDASPWPLGKDWEIRLDEETFAQTGRCFFVNHKDQATTYDCPPPPEPDEAQFPATSMPEYRAFMQRIVKSVESYFSVKSSLERNVIIKGSMDGGANNFALRQSLENHVLNSVHMVMTTLGTAGNRVFEGTDRFEVVVVDEAAQSVEPATLSALQLGSRHCVLVGDPQQLPATIFNVSGRDSKYDRSLFQRMEEAGHPVHMLNVQYRMHPKISHFPRHIFYGGNLLDGPNVVKPDYGNPLRRMLEMRVRQFQPLTILDLDSQEERGGTSLSNSTEAKLALHLYNSLNSSTQGLSLRSRVAIITPYSEQSGLLKRTFLNALGNDFSRLIEVNTVDAFQGREANIVIFSAVRAAGSHGIGFLSDVRRMNVALTRAKHFLFIIARCQSITVNPYWRDLVEHARESNAVVRVPILGKPGCAEFGDPVTWTLEGTNRVGMPAPQVPTVSAHLPKPFRPVDPRAKRASPPRPIDPRKKRKLV